MLGLKSLVFGIIKKVHSRPEIWSFCWLVPSLNSCSLALPTWHFHFHYEPLAISPQIQSSRTVHIYVTLGWVS